ENSGDTRTGQHADRLREAGFCVTLEYTENHGFGAGCNAGAARASGDLLAFVNPDIEFLAPIGGLEGHFLPDRWGGPRQKSGTKLSAPLTLRPEYRNLLTDIAMTRRWLHLFRPLYRFTYPNGAFFVVPRHAFEEVGGFDERFFLYLEEVELSRRLAEKLGPPSVCHEIEVRHEGGATMPGRNEMLAYEARSVVLYARIIGDGDLPARRLRTLRATGRLSPFNARRADHLAKAIEEAAR
ncbi:MAG: hypothetical protein RIC51_03925, partial [Erythrobacter sp.]